MKNGNFKDEHVHPNLIQTRSINELGQIFQNL